MSPAPVRSLGMMCTSTEDCLPKVFHVPDELRRRQARGWQLSNLTLISLHIFIVPRKRHSSIVVEAGFMAGSQPLDELHMVLRADAQNSHAAIGVVASHKLGPRQMDFEVTLVDFHHD